MGEDSNEGTVEGVLNLVISEVKNSYEPTIRALSGAFKLFEDAFKMSTGYIDLTNEGFMVIEALCSSNRPSGALAELLNSINANIGEGPVMVSLGLVCMPSQSQPSYEGEGPSIEGDALYLMTPFNDHGKVGGVDLYCARRIVIKASGLKGPVNIDKETLTAKALGACAELRDRHSGVIQAFKESFGVEPAEVSELGPGSVNVDLPISLNVSEEVKALAQRLKLAVTPDNPNASLILVGVQCNGERRESIIRVSEDGALILGGDYKGCLRYVVVK